MSATSITPETKVATFLEAYPHLQDELIACSTAFAKLRNPVLRRTVARVTSLRQAAMVGGLEIGPLVNRLRRAAGQDDLTDPVTGESIRTDAPSPGWYSPVRVTGSTNASAMLEAGEHPILAVLDSLKKMGPGEVHEVSAPFLPVPMIEKAASLGYLHWVRTTEGGGVVVAFGAPSASP